MRMVAEPELVIVVTVFLIDAIDIFTGKFFRESARFSDRNEPVASIAASEAAAIADTSKNSKQIVVAAAVPNIGTRVAFVAVLVWNLIFDEDPIGADALLYSKVDVATHLLHPPEHFQEFAEVVAFALGLLEVGIELGLIALLVNLNTIVVGQVGIHAGRAHHLIVVGGFERFAARLT